MGRGRKGITEQSQRKPKRTESAYQRGNITFTLVKNRETKKIPVPEHVVDFMKKLKHRVVIKYSVCKFRFVYV